jgi:hypothetical protein
VAVPRRLTSATCAAFAVGVVACGIDAVGTKSDDDGAHSGVDGSVGGDPSTIDGGPGDDDGSTTGPENDGSVDGGGDALVDASSDGGPVIPTLQYLHSSTTLYTVDGSTGVTSSVATFGGACNGITVGDIAIDRAGTAYVATLPPASADSTLHTLNLTTGACSASLGGMGRRCNALTFAPDPADAMKDVLYAACTTSFYEVSTANATTSLIGALGTGLSSSGDIVWVPGHGVYITLNDAASTDKLGSIDVATGAATVIGSGVGRDAIYALGHHAGVILGYGNGFSIKIDPTTGAGSTWNAATGIDAYGAASGP